jgi:lysozyme
MTQQEFNFGNIVESDDNRVTKPSNIEPNLSTMDESQQLSYGEDLEEYDELDAASIWIKDMLPNKSSFVAGSLKAENELTAKATSEYSIKGTTTQQKDSSMTTTQQNEGFRSKVYKDSLGYATIGYGHKLTKEEKKSGIFANGITREEAQKMYEKDEKLHTAGLYKNAPWVKEQPEEVQQVLKDMSYNMGAAFINKWPIFSRQLKEGRYKAAANNILKSRYAKQTKGRAIRNAETLASLQ